MKAHDMTTEVLFRKIKNDFIFVLVFNAVVFYLIFSSFQKSQSVELVEMSLLFLAFVLSLAFFAMRRWDELKSLMQKVHEASVIDALTAVFNREYMQQIMAIEVERSKRTRSSLSVMLIDIDDFKKVNSVYGHETGDHVLLEFSSILTQAVRKVDIVARWEGETFVMLCPDTDDQGAQIAAERVLERVRNASFKSIGKLTASIGLTTVQADEEIDTFMHRAASLLKTAKEGGKDRVAV